jgi:polyhydroxybutyrate depolymerase
VSHDGCSTVPQREEHGNIVCETYSGGRDGTEVVLYTIVGGRHAWPGGQIGGPLGDEPTQEISATDLMWEFFVRHPKDQPRIGTKK